MYSVLIFINTVCAYAVILCECSFRALRACEKTSDFTVQCPGLIKGLFLCLMHIQKPSCFIHSISHFTCILNATIDKLR